MNPTTLGDYLVAQVRTYVPSVIGAVISWLALRGIEVDTNTQLLAVTLGTALATGLYYTAASAVQRKWPLVGRYLLGSKKAPTYALVQGGVAGNNAQAPDIAETPSE
jgi:hypothetical protein